MNKVYCKDCKYYSCQFTHVCSAKEKRTVYENAISEEHLKLFWIGLSPLEQNRNNDCEYYVPKSFFKHVFNIIFQR